MTIEFDRKLPPASAPQITGPGTSGPLRYALSCILWPLLFFGAVGINTIVMAQANPVPWFVGLYFALGATLIALENLMPHEPEWNLNDGQTFANIAHTVLNKGGVNVIIVIAGWMGLVGAIAPSGGGIWPVDWPLWAEVVLGLVLAEFGLYWAHRIAHTNRYIWRFHAVHHSVGRLWVVNTGRFHFMDTIISIALSQPILFLMGAPMEVFLWISSITAFIGLMVHCNIEMRPGPLSYIFNTPELHRWHHSKDLREGDKNFGENLMIWDLVFGTWFNEPRRPPRDIGIKEHMPESFTGQLAAPFKWRKLQEQHRPGEKLWHGDEG